MKIYAEKEKKYPIRTNLFHMFSEWHNNVTTHNGINFSHYLNFKCGMCNTLISSYFEAVWTYMSKFPLVKIFPERDVGIYFFMKHLKIKLLRF